jgi:hypothetical protein
VFPSGHEPQAAELGQRAAKALGEPSATVRLA